jgi:hypothetical protein
MSRPRIRPEYVILAVVIVGLGLAVALRSGNRVRYTLPEVKSVKADDITRITVARAAGSLELEKREGTWRIQPEGYAADPTLVKPMVDALAELSLTALVSEAQSYARYELDEAGRMRVTAYAGEAVVRQLDVGKQDSNQRSSFLLLPGDKRVWSSRQNLRSLLDKDKDKLRDMTVLSFQQDSIVEITAKRGKETLDLKKATEESADKKTTTTTWNTSSGEAWNQDGVTQLLRTLAILRCQRYGDKGVDVGKELVNVFLKAQDGTGYTVSFHEKAGNQYPGLSSKSDYPFYVADYQYQDVVGVFEKPAKK